MRFLRWVGRMFKRVVREPYVDPRATTTYARERAAMESQMRNGL